MRFDLYFFVPVDYRATVLLGYPDFSELKRTKTLLPYNVQQGIALPSITVSKSARKSIILLVLDLWGCRPTYFDLLQRRQRPWCSSNKPIYKYNITFPPL